MAKKVKHLICAFSKYKYDIDQLPTDNDEAIYAIASNDELSCFICEVNEFCNRHNNSDIDDEADYYYVFVTLS